MTRNLQTFTLARIWPALSVGAGIAFAPLGPAIVVSAGIAFAPPLCFALPIPWTGFGPEGIDGSIQAVAEFGNELFVGGNFSRIGGRSSAHVAAFDGAGWTSLDTGLSGAVEALGVDSQGVIAAGNFPGGLARWTGSTWLPHQGATTAPLGIRTLASYDGVLVAGGTFTEVNGEPAGHLAVWDGTSWSAWGEGVNGLVAGLFVDGASLLATGAFTIAGEASPVAAARVARWDGTAWHPLGAGLPAPGEAIAIQGADIVVAGTFPPPSPTSPSTHLWVFDGVTWTPQTGAPNGSVLALAPYQGGLALGGNFTGAGAAPAAHVGLWDGASFATLDGNDGGEGLSGFTLFDLAETPEALFAAGLFEWAGADSALGAARWNGTSWEPLYGTGTVHPKNLVAIGSAAGRLFGCGNFADAGTLLSQRVAEWTVNSWVPLGQGIESYVFAFDAWNEEPVIGGVFTMAGGSSADFVARWDGATWTTLGADPPAGPIYSLVSYEGNLIAGGNFPSAGGETTRGIARWNGASWSPFAGEGVNGGSFPEITALLVDGTSLVAVGSFTSIDGAPAQSVARWHGNAWEPVGAGIPAHVQDATLWNGALVVAGVSGVFRWDGASWETLDAASAGPYLAVRSFQGDLYAGGTFQSVSGIGSRLVARWQNLGTGATEPGDEPKTRFLSPPWPNPSVRGTSWNLRAGSGAERLRLVDLGGRVLREFSWTESPPRGEFTFSWDGRDAANRPVAPGVYFLVLESPGRLESERLVRLR